MSLTTNTLSLIDKHSEWDSEIPHFIHSYWIRLNLYLWQECNGHGTCTCGVCICTQLDSKGNNYTGQFCNICEEGCNRCKELADYVECNFEQDKASCDKTTEQHLNREIIKLNETEIKGHKYRKAKPCSKVLQNGSTMFFKYIDKQNSTLILIQKEVEPAPAANIWSKFMAFV